MKMDNNSTDQEWLKLQVRIDQMFGRYLRDSMDVIEYKPQHPVYLLSTSSSDKKGDPRTW